MGIGKRPVRVPVASFIAMQANSTLRAMCLAADVGALPKIQASE